jgi:hypothetical protein
MKISKEVQQKIYKILGVLIVISISYYIYTRILKQSTETFSSHLDPLPADLLYNNLITNGNFVSGNNITLYSSEHGNTSIISANNPNYTSDGYAVSINKQEQEACILSWYKLQTQHELSSLKHYVLNVWLSEIVSDININLFKIISYDNSGDMITHYQTNGKTISTEIVNEVTWQKKEILFEVPDGTSYIDIQLGNIPSTSEADILITGVQLFQFLSFEPEFPLSNKLLLYLNQDNTNSQVSVGATSWNSLVDNNSNFILDTGIYNGPLSNNIDDNIFTVVLRINPVTVFPVYALGSSSRPLISIGNIKISITEDTSNKYLSIYYPTGHKPLHITDFSIQHIIVLIFDKASNTVNGYIDNYLTTIDMSTGSGIIDNTLDSNPITLDNTLSNVGNSDIINKFLIYNKQLNENEIKSLFAYFSSSHTMNNVVDGEILDELDNSLLYVECATSAIESAISGDLVPDEEEEQISYDVYSSIPVDNYDITGEGDCQSNNNGRIRNININIINDSKLGNKNSRKPNTGNFVFDGGLHHGGGHGGKYKGDNNSNDSGLYDSKRELDNLRNEILLMKHQSDRDNMMRDAKSFKPEIDDNSNTNPNEQKEGWGDGWTYISPKYWRLPQPQAPICLTDKQANVCPTVLNMSKNYGHFLGYDGGKNNLDINSGK